MQYIYVIQVFLRKQLQQVFFKKKFIENIAYLFL